MRLDELRAREDIDALVRETLQTGWSAQYGRDVRITTNARADGQRWLVHPLLSAFYVPQVSRQTRRWLADSFRYTPIRRRAVPQFVLGTAMASRAGLRAGGHSAFWVTPHVPCADDILVVPGNQRLRLLDFRNTKSRVLLKNGANDHAIRNEVRIRGGDHTGPFPLLTAIDPGFTWYEEPLIEGFTLPRCPPWHSKDRYTKAALQAIARWHEATSSDVRTADYVRELCERVGTRATDFRERFSTVDPPHDWGQRLAAIADAESVAELALTHGDFQPGNVLIDTAQDRALVIDWEYSAERSRDYDAFVWGLRARAGRGLATRIARYVRSGDLSLAGALEPQWSSSARRRSAIALFLLEELDRLLMECLSGRCHSPSASYAIFAKELSDWLQARD